MNCTPIFSVITASSKTSCMKAAQASNSCRPPGNKAGLLVQISKNKNKVPYLTISPTPVLHDKLHFYVIKLIARCNEFPKVLQQHLDLLFRMAEKLILGCNNDLEQTTDKRRILACKLN